MNKYEMFVVTHKKFNINLIENYTPIQVGKSFTNLELPYISDDTGDNIAFKNPNYCELTALYWIWKNRQSSEYIGFCHYRRYFVYGMKCKFLDQKRIEQIFRKYDVILPEKFVTKKNVYTHYIESDSGREKDLINLRNIIENLYPDYISDYDFIMNSKSASYCNMMVMKNKHFNDYCEWLFNILFELENITDLTGYTKQEQRIYGFLSEFLLNVWIMHNNLNVKYCSMYYIEENNIKNLGKRLKRGLRSIAFDKI